jgi:hypothetical protein
MTQVYQVAHKTLLDNYAVLETLTPNEVYVGASIVVAGVDATFNGTVSVVAVPEFLFIGVDDEGDLLYNELGTRTVSNSVCGNSRRRHAHYSNRHRNARYYPVYVDYSRTGRGLVRHWHRVGIRYNFFNSMRGSCKRFLFSTTFRKRLHRRKSNQP